MKVNEIIKEVAPADPNSAFKVTRQNPDGSIELADPAGTKINIPREKQAELKQDPANPNQLTLDPNALAKAGQTDTTSGPPIGSTVNISSTIPGQITPTSTQTTAPSETMGSVSETMQEISPKLARYFLRKIDAGKDVSDLINDSAELHTMYTDAALMHHLHPDNDFKKIGQIVINNLNDIADSDYEDDFYDAEVEPEDEYEFESIKRLAGL